MTTPDCTVAPHIHVCPECRARTSCRDSRCGLHANLTLADGALCGVFMACAACELKRAPVVLIQAFAQLARERDAERAALQKLRWCVRVWDDHAPRVDLPDDDALLSALRAQIEKRLEATGWRSRPMDNGRLYEHRDFRGQIPLTGAVEHALRYPELMNAVDLLARAARVPGALVLCELLPEHGPWDASNKEGD